MANRREYYFKQAVTESELNDGFAQLEFADRNLMVDQALVGIFSGGAVAQHSPTPNLTVDVGTPAVAYDNFGERIFVAGGSPLNVNVAQDSSAVSTAVAGGGNEKWISIALVFARSLSDPRVDGNSNTIYFVEDEFYAVHVTQGAEAALGTATRPAIDPDAVLLADVHRTFGQTQVFNADISTTRRQDVFVLAGTTISIRAGTLIGAVQAMLDGLNTHINSLGYAHPASAISAGGMGNWADGTTNPGPDVQTALDDIISDLATSGGTAKIGGAALTAWLDGQQVAAGTLLAQLNGLITGLSSTTASHDGAHRIGFNPSGTSSPLVSTNVAAALAEIDTNFTDFTGNLSTEIGGTAIHFTATETFDDITATAGNHYKLSSRSVTRTQQAGFTLNTAGGYFLASQSVPASDEGQSVMDLPHGAVLTKLAVTVLPSNATPPAGAKVKIQLTKWNLSTGAVTNLYTTTDPTTGTSYGTVHSFDTGTIAETIDRTLYRYVMNLIGETGSGSAGAFLYGFTTTYTVTGIDDGVA